MRKGILSDEEISAIKSRVETKYTKPKPATEPARQILEEQEATPLAAVLAEREPETGDHRRARYLKTRDAKRARQAVAEFVFDSKVDAEKDDAKKVLESRGIQNAHVLDCVHELLLQAAEQHDIPANRFLFQNGIRATLASLDAKDPQTISIPAEPVTGELINRAELFAIFDCSDELDFEEFLQTRQRCKRDCFYLGKEILNKDFAECHRVWSHEFFPQFNPETLPPSYTQRQMISWLDSQSEKKDYLLLASRNSFKSSWSHIWLLTLILCLPDVRVLLVSETRPLSKDFIGAIRGYFEIAKNNETRFQKLFPEYCIPQGDGSVLSLDCPMSTLRLPQSIESSSMDSAVAGRRADLVLFDDPISSTSCGNEVQCAASVSKYDALRKLREVGGFVAVLGTPWRAEIDLYATLLKRNEDDEDRPLKFRIDPAWTLLPEFELKDGKPRSIREIEEHMVRLLFPERLTWKFLRSEMRSNLAFFASQNLCIFPTGGDADIRCTFDEQKLRDHCKPALFFENDIVSKVFLSIDTAFSTSFAADYSCLCTVKILKHDGKDCAVLWDAVLGRWPYSELSIQIVQAIDLHRPSSVVIEKDRTWITLQRDILKAAALRAIVLPHIFWKEPARGGQAPMQKSKRVKALEPLLANDQLWFREAHWTETAIDQIRKFDGVTASSASRKDDLPDGLAIGIQTYFPFNDGSKPMEKSEEQKAAEEAAAEDAKRREIYKQYFGTTPARQPEISFEPEIETNPLFRGAGGSAIRRQR